MVIPNDIFFSWVEKSISEGQSVRFVVHGTSMMPILRNARDEVRLVPCESGQVKTGDIILFRYKGSHILHRVIEYRAGIYYTQGDNVYSHKEFCKAEDIVGKVTIIYRKKCEGKYDEIDPHNRAWLIWSRIRWVKPIAGSILRRFGLR